MDINSMRNIVILKDLPSNLIEEAFVVLKKNQKIRKLEYVEKMSDKFSGEKGQESDIAVKEAELLIADYINKMENQDLTGRKMNTSLMKKYKRAKFFSYILISILSLTLFIIIRG